jgi:hypothetical protein
MAESYVAGERINKNQIRKIVKTDLRWMVSIQPSIPSPLFLALTGPRTEQTSPFDGQSHLCDIGVAELSKEPTLRESASLGDCMSREKQQVTSVKC